jgi:arylsulfatase A
LWAGLAVAALVVWLGPMVHPGYGSANEQKSAAAGKGRPNIIFILADDLGIADVGCCGGAYKTPHVDALAQTGLRFEYCFAAPLCAPSRATCLTGRYVFRTGVVDNGAGGKATPQSETTIAKVLKQAGYATAVAGKWRQLQYFQTVEDGRAWGFDEFLIWGVSGKGERYWDPAYNQNGRHLPDTKDKYGPDLLQQFVVDFIRRHQDQPFFVYYPMVLIHGPILRTPDSTEKGNFYADNIAYMDKLVGKLVAELDRLKLREKTLLVFVGDNGSPRGRTVQGRNIDGRKGSMQEGGSRVPLIASWKGTTPLGQVSKDLIDFSDFFPTLVELAGAKLPQGVTIDGRSFAPQLRGQPGRPREWVYVQLGNQCYVRDPRWKLNNSGVLFDMKDAPYQEIPAAAGADNPEAAAARSRLQAALQQLGPIPKAGQASGNGAKPKKEKAAKKDKSAAKGKGAKKNKAAKKTGGQQTGDKP